MTLQVNKYETMFWPTYQKAIFSFYCGMCLLLFQKYQSPIKSEHFIDLMSVAQNVNCVINLSIALSFVMKLIADVVSNVFQGLLSQDHKPD